MDELDDPFMRIRALGVPARSRTLAERILSVCDLHDFGVELARARARRENPAASAEEIEAAVVAWLKVSSPHDGHAW